MFNKKQTENLEKNILDPFADKIKCDTCKCWIDKKDAQEQKFCGIFGISYTYYCQAHKKPYDRMLATFPPIYFKEIRVGEDGEPLGYTKNKNAK